jgi:hypothetical protein
LHATFVDKPEHNKNIRQAHNRKFLKGRYYHIMGSGMQAWPSENEYNKILDGLGSHFI